MFCKVPIGDTVTKASLRCGDVEGGAIVMSLNLHVLFFLINVDRIRSAEYISQPLAVIQTHPDTSGFQYKLILFLIQPNKIIEGGCLIR